MLGSVVFHGPFGILSVIPGGWPMRVPSDFRQAGDNGPDGSCDPLPSFATVRPKDVGADFCPVYFDPEPDCKTGAEP